jgi:hypothetical protein
MRAKFCCYSIKQFSKVNEKNKVIPDEVGREEIVLGPVLDSDGNRNKSDWRHMSLSPVGDLTIEIQDPEMTGKFKIGQTYFIDITPEE